jgi:NitT/TauT family transport system substrate-binding protein
MREMGRFTVALVALLLSATPCLADTTTLRITGVFGLINLPFYVVADKHMIEEQARAAGLPEPQIVMSTVSGGANAADLLLSGAADVSAGSSTNLMLLWDRTRTMPQRRVLGMMALADSPVFLVTVDPNIKTLSDYKSGDRIAVTNVKSSIQAITLEMAAASAFGWDNRGRLDPLMVVMPHEEGMSALLSAGTEVKSQAAQLPFSEQELQSGKAHLLVTTTDVVGGPSNVAVVLSAAPFKAQNPRLYGAVQAAFVEAIVFINAHKQEAASIYYQHEKQRNGIEWIAEILRQPHLVQFTQTPHATQKLADFMFKTGLLHSRPASWRELFWDPDSLGEGN